MTSTPTRNEEKKGSRLSQAATSTASLSGGLKLSRSEEFLTRISTELTDEALFIAAYNTNPVSTKEKQMEDRGTQISKHGDPYPRTTVSRDRPLPLFFFFFFFFLLFRATPAAYGGSQARCQIRVTAAGLHHSNTSSKPQLRATPQLTAMLDP
uniref:Uncharacterized protein n=1 Tax=Sus scrofa TaxID=9823 RepID=A0A8D1ASX5_PIG